MKIKNILFKIICCLFVFVPVGYADSEMLVSIDNKNYRPLGAGFDSKKQEFRADCVEGMAPHKMLLSAGQLNLKMEASQDSLANKLGISASGRYRSGVATMTASADFLNQSQSNGFSISYNYVAENLFREYIENTNAHPIVARPNIQEYAKDQRTFFANCGDEYVYARDLAARLFVNMKISFISKQERNRFAASFGVDSPVFSMQANLENESTKYSSSNQISITAMQVGGDPSKMGKIICPHKLNGEVDEECAKSSRMVVNCSFGDIKPCMEVIANVIAYANAQDGENFPNQIADGRNYSVTKLFTRPFVYIGAQFPPPPQSTTEDNFQVEVAQLNILFDEDYKNWVYANQLWKGKAPRLSPREKNEMELVQDVFYRNLQRESVAIEHCFGQGYTACTAEFSAVKTFIGYGSQTRKTITDIEKLTIPEVFVQYCDLATSDNPDIAITVKSLQQFLIKNNLIDNNELKRGDICFNLDQKLSAIKILNLSEEGYAVADLRPIAVLSNLQSLNLSNRGLVDVGHLASLKELKTLILDNNLIKDISSLVTLSNLNFISIKNNYLVDLSSLARLPQLERIEARGNSKQLTCPLAFNYQCKLLDFTNAINLALNTNSCDLRVNHAAAPFGNDAILVSGGDSSNGLAMAKNTIEIRTRDSCTLSLKKLLLPRSGHTMTRLPDGRIVVIGGLYDSIEVLDLNLVSHMVKAKMQSSRSRHTATLLNDGRILIVGGYTDDFWGAVRSNNISASVEIFNPQDESLTVVDQKVAPRAEHSATKLADGTVLIVGGYSGERMINLVEVFNPADNSLHEIDEVLLQGRMGHAATILLDGRVLIVGGYQWQKISTSGSVSKSLSALGTAEIFDPQTESFISVEDQLSLPRGQLQSFTMFDGRVLMIGGERSGQIFLGYDFPLLSAVSDIEVFDPSTMGIYQIGHLSFGRAYFAALPIGKKSILISGGTGEQASAMSSELIIYRSVK